MEAVNPKELVCMTKMQKAVCSILDKIVSDYHVGKMYTNNLRLLLFVENKTLRKGN